MGRRKPAPSAVVTRIAEALGKDPQELADNLDPDTLRRTRYPALEERDGEGRIKWKRPIFK